jgi:multidrug resistance efflux pump
VEVLLLAIYSFFVWLIFFKFKWLPWTTTAAVIVVTIPIISMAGLILLLNIYAPSATDVRVLKYVVQVIPRVNGRVIDVPVEPNRLTRKGDVLFRVDPRPFQYEVDRLEAQVASTVANVSSQRAELRAAEAQIGVAGNRVTSILSSIEATRVRRRRPVRCRALGKRGGAASGRPGGTAAATGGRRAGSDGDAGTGRRTARENQRPLR